MHETLRLGRIAGVTVGVNWTVMVVFALIAIVLATAQFPSQFPDLPSGAYVAAGVGTALLFFGSLLAHELAHAVAARRNGLVVEGVVLWLLGGVASFSGRPADPRTDLRISGVGPLVSVALTVGFLSLTAGLFTVGAPGIVVAVAAWLAAINAALVVFNLAPAAPLDGGRLLRALIWRRTGDRLRAMEISSRAGQVFGFLLVAGGLFAFVFLPGIGGLWIALIGGFIMTAAGSEGQDARVRDALEGLTVGDVMTPMPLTVSGELTVAEFIDRYVFQTPHSAFPVVEDGERPIGLVTLNRVKTIAPDDRSAIRIGSAASPLETVPVAKPEDAAGDLLPQLADGAEGRALVVEDGRLVGMVTSRDLMRHLELGQLTGRRPVG